MNKTGLIIKREYLSRVRKKSFVIMTLLGPLLMAAIFVVPVVLAMSNTGSKKILVLDETNLFDNELKENKEHSFEYLPDISLAEAKKELEKAENYALLYIPCGANCDLSFVEKSIQLYTRKTAPIGTTTFLTRMLEKDIEQMKLTLAGVDLEQLERSKTNITLSNISIEGGNEEEKFSGLSTAVGFIAAILIYFFIFLYGAQVMRGVIEEKTSRIVEVIISSVKPFQLLMGKVVGVALVGLTQFVAWVVLTGLLVTVAQIIIFGAMYDPSMLADQMGANQGVDPGALEIFKQINSINFPLILGSFLFYFLGGYLLYGALFAAIGSAVDSETDTQQFMLPVTIPLIFAFIVAQSIMENPDTPMAFWFSMIPLTSPVVMMVRIATGVALWEVILSMVLLVLGFLATVWVASRIYRTGILMYGKKVTYAELSKWIRYKG
jgi:ABC-2 type transport system permease protein